MSPSRRLVVRLNLSAFTLSLFGSGSAGAAEKKPGNSAVRPVPKKEDWWMKRHESFVERAKKGHVDLLFLGDSITHDWEGRGKDVWKERFEPLHAANFGIGGDRTEHLLWRLTEGKELEGMEPKVAVLMIGTNNMGSNTAAEIADGIQAVVDALRKQRPHTKILLLAIFPRSPKPTDMVRDKNNYVNEKIAKLDDGKTVRFLDIGGKFLDKDGNLAKEIMYDFLHLTPDGYKLWADAIQPSLNEALQR